jgi:choline kinase
MTLIEHQVRTILSVYPNANILVVCGFKGCKIRDELYGQFPVRFVYNNEYETSNIVHSISLGMDACLPGNTLIIHGDILFNQYAIKMTDKSSILVAQPGQIDKNKVGLITQNQNVTMLSYGLETQWGQIVYLTDKERKILRDITIQKKITKQWFLYEALNYILHMGGSFIGYNDNRTYVFEINKPNDIKKAITK